MTFLKDLLESVGANRTRLLLLASASIGVVASVFYLKSMGESKLNKLNFRYSKLNQSSDMAKDAERSRFEVLKKR